MTEMTFAKTWPTETRAWPESARIFPMTETIKIPALFDHTINLASPKETSICVVDGSGEIVSEGTVISEPAAIAAFIEAKAVSALRIGFSTRRFRYRASRMASGTQ